MFDVGVHAVMKPLMLYEVSVGMSLFNMSKTVAGWILFSSFVILRYITCETIGRSHAPKHFRDDYAHLL